MSENGATDQPPWQPSQQPEQPAAPPPQYQVASQQSGAAPGYPAPYSGNPYATPMVVYRPQSGLAIAALVTSLLCIPVVGLILSILAMNDTKNEQRSGRGMAIAGLVISIVQTLFIVGWLISAGMSMWFVGNVINDLESHTFSTYYTSSTYNPRA